MNEREARELGREARRGPLDRAVAAIVGQVGAFEAALAAGTLAEVLAAVEADPLAVDPLRAVYVRLASEPPGPHPAVRAESVRALLAQLEEGFAGGRVLAAARFVPRHADAAVAPDPSAAVGVGADLPAAAAQSRTAPAVAGPSADGADSAAAPAPSLPIEARFPGGPAVALRVDQAIAAHFWGIRFAFEDPEAAEGFARAVMRHTVARLAQDLAGVHKVLLRFDGRDVGDGLVLLPAPKHRRFEHLMLDILNEDAPRARFAPLVEDFLEKTDLRVRYPGLGRPHGGRVQVTQISRADLHGEKLAAIRRVAELVILSPLALAESLLPPDEPIGAALGDALGMHWPAPPASVEELAGHLRACLLDAVHAPLSSPLGPLAVVPAPLRALIRRFVREETFRATQTLRVREQRAGAGRSASAGELDGAGAAVGARQAPPEATAPAGGDPALPARAAETASARPDPSSAAPHVPAQGEPAVPRRGRIAQRLPFGVLVDVGGAVGLLHQRDLTDPAVWPTLTVGREVAVAVVGFDPARGQLCLRGPCAEPARDAFERTEA